MKSFIIVIFLAFAIVLISCGKKEGDVSDVKKEAPKTETQKTTTSTSNFPLPTDFPLEVAAFKSGIINSTSESGDIKSVSFKPDGFPEDIAQQIDKELSAKGFKKSDDDKNADRMIYEWKADKKRISLYIYLKNNAKESILVSYKGF